MVKPKHSSQIRLRTHYSRLTETHWKEIGNKIVIHKNMSMTKTNTRIVWIVIRTEMCMTKTNKNMESHSYEDVHDEKTIKNNNVVIRTQMCMTKTHAKIILQIVIRTKMSMTKTDKNTYRHSYRDVHDENI